MKTKYLFLLSVLLISSCNSKSKISNDDIVQLGQDAILANEGFRRSYDFVEGWLKYADPISGLIPKSLHENYWNAQDAGADNYPFMVLTSFFTDSTLFNGRMKDILSSEIKNCSRLGACPASFNFKTQSFLEEKVDSGNVVFGSAEFMKDGLIPLTEWLGRSLWSDRMVSILDDLKDMVSVVTEIKAKLGIK